MRDFAHLIKELTQSNSTIISLPATKDDPQQRKPDISTAKKYIKWQPVVDVRDGLKKTIEYFRRELEESGEIIQTGPLASRPQHKKFGRSGE